MNTANGQKHSEAYYQAVFENTGTATVIIEQDTTISLANSRFEKLSGYSKQELEGVRSWTDFVVEEDLTRMKEYHNRRREDPEAAPTQYEFRFINRSGGIRNILLTVDVIPGTQKSVGSLLDITRRKQAEEAVERSEQKYREIIRDMQEGFFRIDANGIIELVNPALVEILGCESEESLLGNNINELECVDMKMKEEWQRKIIEQDEYQELMDLGFESVLKKPFEFEVLLRTLRQIFDKRR